MTDPDDHWLLLHSRTSGARYHYTGIARLAELRPMLRRGHHALQLTDFLEFHTPVEPRINGYSIEPTFHGLRNKRDHARDAKILRYLPWDQFRKVINLGTAKIDEPGMSHPDQAAYIAEDDDAIRDTKTWLVSRAVRDPSNRKNCLNVYDRCIFTGERQLDRDGTTICEAAHLWPVERGGPDHIKNLALMTPTFHDAYDKGLIAISDDFEIIRGQYLPANELRTPGTPARLTLPDNKDLWPDLHFIQRHRQAIFRR